jgi:hypothetical protein
MIKLKNFYSTFQLEVTFHDFENFKIGKVEKG